MSTRSRIGLALAPDHIISVYCHHDGYIQGVGRDLKKYYKTKEQVQELIDGGGMSDLHTNHTWGSMPLKRKIIKADGEIVWEYMRNPNGTYMYDIEKEVPGPLYYTERGEEVEVKWCNFEDFLTDNADEEWVYLFDPGHGWSCWKLGYGKKGDPYYEPLTRYNMITEQPYVLEAA